MTSMSFMAIQKEDSMNCLHESMMRLKSPVIIRPKLRGIHRASQWSYKVYEFTYGCAMDSGTVYFGMIALGKEQSSEEDSFDAVTCLYKLDSTVAKIKVEKRKPKRTFGFKTGTHRRYWRETKKIL